MDLGEAIYDCQRSISQLYRLTLDLQSDGIPFSDPVFDHIAEKSWYHVLRLELLFSLDPRNRFVMTLDHLWPEIKVPSFVLPEFTPYRLEGLNPNDHYHLQS